MGETSIMKLYRGIRTMPGYVATVYVEGELLAMGPSKLDIHDYGADALEWGYFGAGPSQTAAAILYDITADPDLTKRYHQDFKREFIANFEQNSFILLETQVWHWLAKFKKSEEGL